MVDYSQFGQALLFPQLLTRSTPRVLVDIGAHDGINCSNSRALLEAGWRGVLVEPVPAIFSRLQENSRSLKRVSLLQAACSDRRGIAALRLGVGGPQTALSSLSTHPQIASTLTGDAVQVNTTTLADLFAQFKVPDDFGILMIDTEGLDFTVLQQLETIRARPRLIVTEEFAPTDGAKHSLLKGLGYQFLGVWGADSFWAHPRQKLDITSLRIPIFRLPSDWQPSGKQVSGKAHIDHFQRPAVLGWAFLSSDKQPGWAALELQRVDLPPRYVFRALRFPREDVANIFGSAQLLLSGLRVPVDVPGGKYAVRVYQQGDGCYSVNDAGLLDIPD